MGRGGRSSDLLAIVTTRAELGTLFAATYKAPQTALGLPAWIDGAAERPFTGADPDRPELADKRPSLDESERQLRLPLPTLTSQSATDWKGHKADTHRSNKPPLPPS